MKKVSKNKGCPSNHPLMSITALSAKRKAPNMVKNYDQFKLRESPPLFDQEGKLAEYEEYLKFFRVPKLINELVEEDDGYDDGTLAYDVEDTIENY